ncbi:MAG: hypothetical protein IJ848_02610 [Alphaproteobacteria bacterium]|nr:hypothetical protein [Alphaproteobacteria bacterium]
MIKKVLYCIAVLSAITIGNINASSLIDVLNNPNNTVMFNSGTISCNNNVLNQDDYIAQNNTSYINTSVLPIIKANMTGSSNISFQDLGNTNNVPNSITFSGNNTSYSGILYLHPAIDTINFKTIQSIIRNINIPNSVINIQNNTVSTPTQKRRITINLPGDSGYDRIEMPSNLNIICNPNSSYDVSAEQFAKILTNYYNIISKEYKIYINKTEAINEILNELNNNLAMLKETGANEAEIGKFASKYKNIAGSIKDLKNSIITIIINSLNNKTFCGYKLTVNEDSGNITTTPDLNFEPVDISTVNGVVQNTINCLTTILNNNSSNN